MKKTCLAFFVLVLACLASAAVPQKVFEIDLTISKNNTAELSSIKTAKGFPTESDAQGNYLLKIFDAEGKELSSARFIVYFFSGEPFTATDTSFAKIFLPFDSNADSMVLEKDSKELLEIGLKELVCNSNAKCEENETFLSCPKDCSLDKPDGICIAETDNVCDPDCYKGADFDCVKQQIRQPIKPQNNGQQLQDVNKGTSTPKQAQPSQFSGLFLIVFGIAAILIIVLVIFARFSNIRQKEE